MLNQVCEEVISKYVLVVLEDSFWIIPGLIPPEKLDRWGEAFKPLLERHIKREGQKINRGPSRCYVTLPFLEPFSDPEIFDNDVIMAVVEGLVGRDGVMCQLATDTPLQGSYYQEVHRPSRWMT